MLDNLFRGIFDTDMTAVISVSGFLICVGTALIAGIILAVMYMYKTRYTKSFAKYEKAISIYPFTLYP